MNRDEIEKLLEGTTPGPWTVETGNVPIADTGDYDGYCRLMAGGRIIFEQWGDDEQSEKDAHLAGAAPDLARTVIALHADRDRLAAENAALEAKLARLVGALDGNRPIPFDRETAGRFVREAWVRWAHTQPSPKASWLVPYDDLSEADKEADRQIGEALARWTLIHDAAALAEVQARDEGAQEESTDG